MSLRSAVALVVLGAYPAFAQSRLLDEGAFVVLKGGVPALTESFKIMRNDGGLITATGRVTRGTNQTMSSLTTDSLGTPIQYELHVMDKGSRSFDVKAQSRAGRLTLFSSTQAGDESMREYPLVAGQSLILEPSLLHHLYFVVVARRSGVFQVVEPRDAHVRTVTLVAMGLEPIEVAGRSITATHYSLNNAAARYDFWVDAQGRLLRVDVPSQGISATREEVPR